METYFSISIILIKYIQSIFCCYFNLFQFLFSQKLTDLKFIFDLKIIVLNFRLLSLKKDDYIISREFDTIFSFSSLSNNQYS